MNTTTLSAYLPCLYCAKDFLVKKPLEFGGFCSEACCVACNAPPTEVEQSLLVEAERAAREYLAAVR